MSWTARVEQPGTRGTRAWLRDAAVLLAPVLLGLPYAAVSDDAPSPRWLAVLGMVLLVAPLLVRRIWPMPVFLTLIAVAVGFGIWDLALVGNLALPIGLYTVAGYGTRRQTYLATAILEVLGVAGAASLGAEGWLLSLVFLTAMVAAATGLGLYTATRRAYVSELKARAERLENERAQAQELATAAERARIAREMHDIVAHHLTVVVALSDAATRLVATDPQRAVGTLEALSGVGRAALRDTRGLLGVLASPAREAEHGDAAPALPVPAPLAPMPDLAGLDALVAQVRQAGLPVELLVSGQRPELPAETQLAAYRLVQESLTNTMKHAPAGTSARVSLRYEPTRLWLLIADDGAAQRGAATRAGRVARAGRGLTGMRARVTALGGTFASGPVSPGWRVEAVLPYQRGDNPVGERTRGQAQPVQAVAP